MSQDIIKERIESLYGKYLTGNITRSEYEEMFDLIQDESNQHILETSIDRSVPAFKDIKKFQLNPVLSQDDRSNAKQRRLFHRSILYWVTAAASVSILVLALFFMFNDADVEWTVYSTGFQETRTIELPDASIVVLNANSELKWKDDFGQDGQRKVEFRGEGFFNVAHMDDKKFIVQTGSMDVNVLGTEFNVETRRDYTNVFLKEGKVILQTKNQKPVEMSPGDMVHYNESSNAISKTSDHSPDVALSWKEGVFTFTGLSGLQILDKMEDIYGKEFIIESPGELTDIIVVQGLPYTDWDFTREALELALDVRFTDSTANRIIVKAK